MSVRSIAVRSLSILLGSTLVLAIQPGLVHAEDAPAAQADNSKMSFAGIVNANDVFVRSGPGDNYYATLKFDKGASVTVVGLKFDWLKILPPDGSFSYVAKAYVEKRGDGTVGRVTKPELNVRAGSSLNAMKSTVQTKLDDGADVQILGEQDEYFKIKPPAGAFLYVNKQFVDQGKALPTMEMASDAKSGDPIASAPIMSKTPDTSAAATATTQPAVAAAPTTQSSDAVAVAPSTQPAMPTAEVQFDAAEAAFLDASNQQLQVQPIDDLLAKYDGLTREEGLPVSMRRIAELRISTLKTRAEARNQYLEAMKMVEQAHSRQLALKAEQQELEQRVKDQDVTTYTALGTLRTSALQQPGGALYRLTDPGTGRTLLYVRSDDPKYASMLNQFVGVRGEITEDAALSLKIIAPTAGEPVDQAKVNTTITAQLIPPTMLPKMPTASAAN